MDEIPIEVKTELIELTAENFEDIYVNTEYTRKWLRLRLYQANTTNTKLYIMCFIPV